MHGIILIELKRYVESSHSREVWQQLLAQTNNSYKTYTSLQLYPEGEVESLVAALSAYSGQDQTTVYREWGRFTAPNLIKMYKWAIDPQWRSLDFLDHLQGDFHIKVTQRYGASPPAIVTKRIGLEELELIYTSKRQMCEFAWGLAQGVADNFGEQVEIVQPECMHRGAAQCKIRVKLVSL